MNNIVKVKKNNNSDFLNDKDDFKRGNKRRKKPYNKKMIIRIRKYKSLN